MPVLAQSISRLALVSAAAIFASVSVQPAQAQSANATFFVSSVGLGKVLGPILIVAVIVVLAAVVLH